LGWGDRMELVGDEFAIIKRGSSGERVKLKLF